MNVGLIIAAGEASRWNNYLGTRKHFIRIDGEPIIDRTGRLLRENDYGALAVVKPEDFNKFQGFRHIAPVVADLNPVYGDADKFLSSSGFWNKAGRTIVLYGDVFFTEEAIKTIVEYKGKDYTLFGRASGSTITGSKWGECFAISFYPKDHKKITDALEKISYDWRNGRLKRCGGWELYREIVGIPITEPHKITTNFVEINDFTEDFDYPEDYDEFIKRYKIYKEG